VDDDREMHVVIGELLDDGQYTDLQRVPVVRVPIVRAFAALSEDAFDYVAALVGEAAAGSIIFGTDDARALEHLRACVKCYQIARKEP
jgi:hypothetical protein